MLKANEATYERLSTFDSVDQLNDAVRKHKSTYDLSATEMAILDVLARHSCVYKGVSFLTKSNIGKLVGKSRRTIIRVCTSLEERGIIRQYDMKRVSGDCRQTSNAVVIQEQKNKAEHVTPAMSRQKAQTPLKTTNTISETVKREGTNNHLSSLRQSIPENLYESIAPFFGTDELYEVIGTLYRAKASVDSTIIAEDHIEYIDAFKACIRLYKSGRVKKLHGYLYAAWAKVSREIKRRMTYACDNGESLIMYDWLKEEV